jgi:hypothetical protein
MKEEINIDELKKYMVLRSAKCAIALDGLSDDALDGGWNFKDFSAYVCKIEKERDRLLIALEELSFAAQTSGGTAGRDDFLCKKIENSYVIAIESHYGIEKQPCGECHLRPDETCDICGAKEKGGVMSKHTQGTWLHEAIAKAKGGMR